MGKAFLALAVRAAAILLVGAVLGVGVNALRADGLGFGAEGYARIAAAETGACTTGPKPQTQEVDLLEAKLLHAQPRVTFVDARAPEAYRAGHVRGAINLPYEVAAEAAGKTSLPVPQDHRVVVYCDYVNCGLSSELAQLLTKTGCERVRVLRGGFPAWRDVGLPTTKGERP